MYILEKEENPTLSSYKYVFIYNSLNGKKRIIKKNKRDESDSIWLLLLPILHMIVNRIAMYVIATKVSTLYSYHIPHLLFIDTKSH